MVVDAGGNLIRCTRLFFRPAQKSWVGLAGCLAGDIGSAISAGLAALGREFRSILSDRPCGSIIRIVESTWE